MSNILINNAVCSETKQLLVELICQNFRNTDGKCLEFNLFCGLAMGDATPHFCVKGAEHKSGKTFGTPMYIQHIYIYIYISYPTYI